MDPYQILRISRNPDGSLTRDVTTYGISPPTNDTPDATLPALSKDVVLSPTHNTSIRIFRPIRHSPESTKLPVILNFHGGGFVLFSPASTFIHASNSRLAGALPAIVLSVDYRLAPEHRLPAAYHDAIDGLLWLLSQARNPSSADPWIASIADFSRCFLMGSSAGGNIAYQAALRALEMDIQPLKLEGLVLNQPYFGGEERTESEVRLARDKILPLPVNDLLWELSLPDGATRDHEYANPMKAAAKGGGAGKGLPRCLIRGFLGDPLIDRQRELGKMLERDGVSVVARLDREGHHGIDFYNPEKAAQLVTDVREFVHGSDGAGAGGRDIVLRHRL